MSAALFVLDHPDSHQRAAALAARLSLPLHASLANASAFVAALEFRGDCLQMRPVDDKQSGPVCVDFCTGANAHRLQGGAELIVKAVRGRSKDNLTVLDATAGLGRDSFVLASRGLVTHMLERSPIVAALLADGIERARHCGDARLEEVVSRMSLQSIDACSYLAALPESSLPDVIYLDPMFPPSDKSALVKKEMRLFQQLFHTAQADGVGEDDAELLLRARRAARLRVVVKRPRKAQALANAQPDYALEGKSVRFDVYLPQR
jgi:16S rRNA (guanine1516-N2)-methyltransferase